VHSAQEPQERKYDNNWSLPASDTPGPYETVRAAVKRVLDAVAPCMIQNGSSLRRFARHRCKKGASSAAPVSVR